jgi:hypothetical protein
LIQLSRSAALTGLGRIVGRFTQGDAAFALGYYLSLRWSFDLMNTKDFLRLGVPLGQATRRATDFISKFILGGGDKSRLHEEVAAVVANPSAFVATRLRSCPARLRWPAQSRIYR